MGKFLGNFESPKWSSRTPPRLYVWVIWQ